MRRNNLKKINGFSLIEILIALVIFMFLTLGMSSSIVFLSRQNKALQQKIDSISLEQTIVRLLSDNNSCQCMFENIPWPQQGEISLNSLKNGCGSDIISTSGILSNYSNSGLTISSIKLINLKSISATQKSADLVIDFDSTKLAGPLSSIKLVAQGFITNNIGGQTQIQQCLGIAGASIMCESMGGTWSNNICTFKSTSSSSGSAQPTNCSLTSCRKVNSQPYGLVKCDSDEVITEVFGGGTQGGQSGIYGITCCSISCSTSTSTLPTSPPTTSESQR